MKKIMALFCAFTMLLSFTACHSNSDGESSADGISAALKPSGQTETPLPEPPIAEEEESMSAIRLFVGEKELAVEWEDNESVDALKELVKEHPLTIQMSMYGGFEQVGALGVSLPREDVQTTTNAGDIVLYSGDQIVIFYGSNSWAYTKLGKVSDLSADDMTELLGRGGHSDYLIELRKSMMKGQTRI